MALRVNEEDDDGSGMRGALPPQFFWQIIVANEEEFF